ncbi:hypothetical protein MYAM1_002762 [Malassezia yamatoensis]|uniref:NADH:ubiquinone reductase (non-electrogenic) n=1 Tax=Malassezia yamatoensis TaxID=253288 RepID=A0AAJ6CI87_9BASI|nr:hypothetical protein MYAM1_002762 [Malassezia yamatoensis]
MTRNLLVYSGARASLAVKGSSIANRRKGSMLANYSQVAQTNRTEPARLHKVVVVGAGFGGVMAVNALKGAPVEITVLDRSNSHVFQPLLYQVGSCALPANDIAWPIRQIFAKRPEVTTLMGEVCKVDRHKQEVFMKDDPYPVPYDTLILASGARDSYFGNDHWEKYAPGLKTLQDATTIRRRLLLAFELAEREEDPERRKSLLTFAMVGGGPTGVELAGQIAQMAHSTLPKEFRNIDTKKARVVLIEAGPRLLSAFPEDLSMYAKHALEDLGVEVWLEKAVSDITADNIQAGDQVLDCKTIFWAAGVQASPAHEWIGAKANRTGCIKVKKDLSVAGYENIFAIGDTAEVMQADGSRVPGIAPAAKQMGTYVGRKIRKRIDGRDDEKPFRYVDMGSLATIGKRKAVIRYKALEMKGALAWWLWGIAHIYFLINIRSRMSVGLNWLYNFTRNMRGSRIITQDAVEEYSASRRDSRVREEHCMKKE